MPRVLRAPRESRVLRVPKGAKVLRVPRVGAKGATHWMSNVRKREQALIMDRWLSLGNKMLCDATLVAYARHAGCQC